MIHCFPGAAAVVSTLHLQDNVQRKLDAVAGKKDKTRKTIVHDIFGCSGLTSCSDVISFKDALGKFRSDTLSEAPGEFKTYFEHALVDVLRDNVAACRNT